MLRIASLALLVAACGSHDTSSSAAPAPAPDRAAPPVAAGPPGAGADPAGKKPFVDDPKFHLRPEEGTLDVGKAEAKAGAEAVAALKLTPASGYHISTDFPIKLTLEAPDGVALAKAELTAGKGEKGDAEPFSEQALGFSIKATAAKAGAYEVKGVFRFGVCDKDSCHPKKQPITISVAAS